VRALIVEDGWQRGALAAARALAAAGWEVGAAVETPGFAADSRFTCATHLIPPPAADPDGFVDAVAAAVAASGYELVFPAGDAQLLVLSDRRDRLGAVFPYAPHATVVRALDKQELSAAAVTAGLEVPDAGGGPFVVKPRVTMSARAQRLRAAFAATTADADAAADELRHARADPLVQRAVEGRLVALVVVAGRDGRLLARCQQVASALWPATVGGSVRAETTAVDEQLAAAVERLLRELGWFGLAQLQFIVPERGNPRLIDLNGRFYGSLALALAAGPNLPAIWAAIATGRPAPPGGDARAGVRYHWLGADLRRAGLAALPYAFGATHGLWRLDDPLPAARHAVRVAGRLLRERLP
jgi:predicted ATP-grasp superfamily ATP-dependent carboligase